MTPRVIPVGHLDEGQVRSVLSAAMAAPSPHDSRPWEFHCTAATIELHADMPARPAPRTGDLLRGGPAEPAPRDPRTRGASRGSAAPGSAPTEPARHRPATGPHRGRARRPGAGRRHLSSWHRPRTVSPHGRAPAGSGRTAPGGQDRTGLAAHPHQPRSCRSCAAVDWAQATRTSTPLVAVIGTFHDSPLARLQAGLAMQRVLLAATVAGLSASFLSQVVAVPATRQQLRELVVGGLWPQAVLRLGYSTATGTPRATSKTRSPADRGLARTCGAPCPGARWPARRPGCGAACRVWRAGATRSSSRSSRPGTSARRSAGSSAPHR